MRNMLALMCALVLWATSANAKEPFGLNGNGPNVEFAAAEDLSLWRYDRLWSNMRNTIEENLGWVSACRGRGDYCAPQIKDFVRIVEQGNESSREMLADRINRVVNKMISEVPDTVQYRRLDYWASPLQTMTSRRGDCEDFAILKYAALIDAGVSEQDLRLVAVRHRVTKSGHLVLAVKVEGKWLMLDNAKWYKGLFTEENYRRHYAPTYVLPVPDF